MISSLVVSLLLVAAPSHAEIDTADQYGWPITKWLYDYNPLRKSLHDRIVQKYLRAGVSEDEPRLIFTAGGYGAGKSFVTAALEKFGLLDVDRFIWIDPDPIKDEIPEYAEFMKKDPATAATLVHRESGHIQLALVEEALRAKKNIIIDGSLRARDWWDSEFKRIRAQYPAYSISIFYVTASDDQMLARVRNRALVTNRHIPERVVLEAASEVRDSVAHLAPLANFTVEIDNGSAPTIKSILHHGRKVSVHLDLSRAPTELPRSTPSPPAREFDRVVVLTGYGKIGYENYSLLQAYVRTIAAQSTEKTLFVVGTPLGIGRARGWVPFSAEMSEKAIVAMFDDPSLAGKVEVFGLRGGPAAARVLERARAAGIRTTLIRDSGLEPETEGVALRLIRNASFEPDATLTFERRPDGVNVVRTLDVPAEHRTLELRTRRLRQLYRAVETVSDRELVETALETYPELLLLTEGTIANPEAEFGANPPPATADLPPDLAHFRPTSDVRYPAPIASVPDDLQNSLSRAYFGKAYPEFDRTISMLLLFKRLLGNDYDGFTRGQPEGLRLTRASFDELAAFIRTVAFDPGTRDVLFSFLIFNNVGKAKPVIEYLRRAGNIRDFNHQRIMPRILATYGFVSPTYQRLDENQQRLLSSAFEREFALGMHTHGELPARFLTEYPSRSERERDFYLATYFLKAAAGRGHLKQLGSLVMTEPMYRNARAAIESLTDMDGSKSSAIRSHRRYLKSRATTLLPPGAEVWVARIALMLRCLTATEGAELWAAVQRLSESDFDLLEREFYATGFEDNPALLLYYGTAVFDNLKKVTAPERTYDRALQVLVRTLRAARSVAVAGVTQVRLDRVANEIRERGQLPEVFGIETFIEENFGLSVRLSCADALESQPPAEPRPARFSGR